MVLPEWLEFRPRLFPSCNFAWLAGPRPVLVDSGFGSDLEATPAARALPAARPQKSAPPSDSQPCQLLLSHHTCQSALSPPWVRMSR